MEDAVEQLQLLLPKLIETASHSEIWSIPLTEPSAQRTLVLRKYLAAHNGAVQAASDGILATLKWRKDFDPIASMTEAHDEKRFGGLGFVTAVNATTAPSTRSGGGGRKSIVTWNIYGAVKDHAQTFGNVDEFLRWRVGLMERGVGALRLMDEGVQPPADDIAMVQVHDYMNVSFLRLPSETKAATKKVIEVLGAHYPELLSRKYFVNVPVVMGWMFSAMKLFLAKETVAKFQVLSYGSYMGSELGDEVPKEYGGEGPSLKEQDLPSVAATQVPAATEPDTTVPIEQGISHLAGHVEMDATPAVAVVEDKDKPEPAVES